MINSVSIANCDMTSMGEELAQCVAGGASFFHVDIIDGHYLKNVGMPLRIISDIKRKYPDSVLDVHTMVTNPMDYIPELKKHGADYVSFHADSTNCVIRTLKTIREAGMKAGVVLNPSQRVDILEPYIGLLDMVIYMAVEPGFAGQSFLDGSMERLQRLVKMRKEHNCKFMISVDGGVNYDIGKELKSMGIDIIIGTVHTIFNQPEGLTEACKRFARELG